LQANRNGPAADIGQLNPRTTASAGDTQ